MSLEFTGYHCTVTQNCIEVAKGFSQVGPLCSPVHALREALLDPTAAETLSANEMYWTRLLQVDFLVGTAMPVDRQLDLPSMHNSSTNAIEYNPTVHAFVEEIKALQARYGMHCQVNTMGRAIVTRNIVPIKVISYNLEK